MPKISVIIPIYNTEKYLERCLDSVCNQTLSDIEIICVNDCSTDSSLEILKKYSRNDSRIKLINLEENKGVATARNIGIDIAEGEYIGFVDSDDYIDLNFYLILYNSAVKNKADATKGKIVFPSNQYDINKDNFYDINDLISNDFAYFYHSFTTGIYRRDFIIKNNIKFPEQYAYFEDPYFSILASLHYQKINIENEAKYYYFYREDSACSQNNVKRYKDEINAIAELVQIINKTNISKKKYLITYGYFVRHALNMAYAIMQTDAKKDYLDFCFELYSNCKYQEDQIDFYLYEKDLFKKRYEKKERLLELRKKVLTTIKK